MGSEAVNEASTTPKLSLFSLPSQPPEPAGMVTPPLQTSVSVPFQWEEAPGKPRHSTTDDQSKAKCVRSLELPPRLLLIDHQAKVTNMPSPTTVLDGPDVGRAMSFSFASRSSQDNNWGKRVAKETRGGGGFGSMRWGSFRKNNKEVVDHGGFDFLPAVSGGGGCGDTKVKITRVRRRASFLSVSQTKSHMWASIYEGIKQVVPWRRRQEKMRKLGS